MTRKEAYVTNLELRESTPTGEAGAGLSHSAEGLVLLHVLEVAAYAEPRGVVTVLHDAGDHGGRYEDLAHRLAEKDWAVALPDLRGHGRSEGEKGHSNGLREVQRDVEEIQNHLAYRLPEAPKILVGCGLGALYAMAYALERQGEVAGLVLVSPLLKPNFILPEAKKGLRAMFGKKIGPKSEGSLGWTVEQRTQDADQQAKIRSDSLVHDVITVRAAEQALEAAGSYPARLKEVGVPVLILQGENDDIAPASGARGLEGEGIDLRLLNGCRHDLFHEKEDAAQLVLDWLEAQSF